MSTIAICLYSKYSQRCKEFLDEMGEDLDVQMVSIDNKKVRDKILRDDQGYHIKTVPCIFLLFQNGRLEKYEGSDAFVWLRKVKEAILESTTPATRVEPSPETTKLVEAVAAREELSSAVVPDEFGKKVKANVEKMMDEQNSMRTKGTEQFITKKQDNIKELAQQMQRQRETEEETNNPPPPNLPLDR